MKKMKKKFLLILSILFICCFSVIVYAYSSYATASVSPEGLNDIYFHANNNSDASPANIKQITHYATSSYMDVVIASANYGDDQHMYNSLSSHYTKTDAEDGVYSEYVRGYTEYMPPITYTDTVTDTDSYRKGSEDFRQLNSDIKKFADERDKKMADALNIHLSSYKKIDTLVGFMTPEHDELSIGDVRVQIPLKYGSTIPSVYLNKENTHGIALVQDLQGVYTLYKFEANKNEDSRFKWTITETETVQGELEFINESVKSYFEKNPNPPTYKYEAVGNKLMIIVEDNN